MKIQFIANPFKGNIEYNVMVGQSRLGAITYNPELDGFYYLPKDSDRRKEKRLIPDIQGAKLQALKHYLSTNPPAF